MDVNDAIEQMKFKTEALTELIKIMGKYHLSFVSETEYLDNGEVTKLKVLADYFEDGDPILLQEVAKVGRTANMEIEDMAGISR